MKKLFTTLFVILFTLPLIAQEELWDGPADVIGEHAFGLSGRDRAFDFYEFRIENQRENWQDTTIEYCTYTFLPSANAWDKTNKFIITFDSQGRETDRITQRYTTQWFNSQRVKDEYDMQGKKVKTTSAAWDAGTSSFIVGERDTFIYDVNGFLIQERKAVIPSGSTSLEDRWIWDITNDNVGNITEGVFTYWDTGSNSWITSSKKTYSYNGNNQLVESRFFEWNTTFMAWAKLWEYTQSFSASGKPLEQISYDIGMGFGGVFRNEFIYDANDRLVNYNYYGGFGSNWVPEIFYSYSYDASGRPIEVESHEFFAQSITSYTQSYNQDNQIQEVLFYGLNPTDSSFFLKAKSELMYDAQGDLMQDIEYTRDTANSVWNSVYRAEVCDFTAHAAEDELLTSVQLFPNPTTGNVNLKALPPKSRISIQNSLGQTLFQQRFMQEEVRLDLSALGSRGLYFIHVQDGNRQQVFKVIYY